MFSNRFRLLKIVAHGIILLVLCLYSYKEGPNHYTIASQIPGNSQDKDGMTIRIDMAKVIKVPEKGRVLLRLGEREIEVRTNQGPIKPGDRISVMGRFHKGGFVEAETITIHRYRWLKKLVSAITALIVLALVGIRYRISFADRSIVERDSCRI